VIGESVSSSMISMTSSTVVAVPPATLSTVAGATSAPAAARFASTMSPTNVKSRIWRPSPNSGNASPESAASINRCIAMSGRCLGPKTVKYRKDTTGSPRVRAYTPHRCSAASFVTP